MSATFSFSRLGKLITKQFFENARLYMFAILAIVGLLALAFAFWILTGGGPRFQEEATYFIFIFGLYTTGFIFASMSFNMLGSKDKGTYWLGIPATHFEKLLCTIFYSTVAFTLAYCICFFVVKSVAIAFLQQYTSTHPGTSYTEIKGFEEGFGSVLKYFIYAYFAIQSLYLLGSVYFSRYSFIVTSVVGALIIFAFGYYITTIQEKVLGPISWDFISARKTAKDGYWLYSVSPALSDTVKFLVKFAWAPVFWVVTWYRLKEKEL